MSRVLAQRGPRGRQRFLSLVVAAVAAGLLAPSSAHAQSPTASARYDLAQAWIAICQAPCLVRTLGSAPALIAVAASPPVGDDAAATVLTSALESGLPFTGGGTVYARAFSNTTRVVVMPYASGGNGGGGGGDASAVNQQAAIASLGADGASPPAIAGTGVRGWLRAIYERLTGTLAVSAGSLPLPAGASTEATQQGVATSIAAISTATGGQSDAATASGANTSVVGALRAIRDRLLGTLPVAVTSSALPTGAATAANQTTASASLASIDGKTPALVNGGQPVVQTATSAIGVQRTTGIGTTGVQVSASDPTNRRTVTNTSGLACELMGSAAAYGTGYPLPAGGSFTFDASGRTTAALFVACSASGGTVAVLSY